MASLNTSEFQFGYIFFAKFNQLNNYRFHHVFMPNQRQEGDALHPFRGTDIVLGNYFFQVKMSKMMVGVNAQYAEDIGVPFFKFNVYNSPRNNNNQGQLDFLKIHAANPANNVYYVAPCFNSNVHDRHETSIHFWCYDFYRCIPAEIWDFATLIDIDSIQVPWIEPNNLHDICYQFVGDAFYFSERKLIRQVKIEIESDDIIMKRATQYSRTLNETIKSNFQEIKDFFGDKLIDTLKIDTSKIDLFQLQEIYLSLLNVFWLPFIIPETTSR